ncbi:MAG: 16S rRNA (guanine(527)-N(7))-methyltransferase RsmG [Desulfobacterales bacterium]
MDAFAVGSDQWIDCVVSGAARMGIRLNAAAAQGLARHAAETVLWNKKINLTAITDPVDFAVKHVLDSMQAAPFIPRCARVMDVGSGGGFPGMVLKIVRPDLTMVLVDASRKKVSFLKHIIRLLSLQHIEARHARTEELERAGEWIAGFDVVISRAFSSLWEFYGKAGAFVKEGGMMIAYKGGCVREEIQHFLDRSSNGMDVKTYRFSHFGMERALVILQAV